MRKLTTIHVDGQNTMSQCFVVADLVTYLSPMLKNLLNKLFGGGTDYRELVQQGAIVVDVRTPAEYKEGHAPNSISLPLDQLQNRWKKLQGKTVVVVCRSGMRAGKAKSFLTSKGIEAHNAGPWQQVA